MLGLAFWAAGAAEIATRKKTIQTERDLMFISISRETYALRFSLVSAVQIDWANKRKRHRRDGRIRRSVIVSLLVQPWPEIAMHRVASAGQCRALCARGPSFPLCQGTVVPRPSAWRYCTWKRAAPRPQSRLLPPSANFAGLEDRNRAHASTHRDALHADKLGVERRLAVLQEHRHNLAQVDVQFIKRGRLRAPPPGKPRTSPTGKPVTGSVPRRR